MRDEYDFSKGVRGKHYKAYREGHTVIIHKDDGTKLIQYFTQQDGAVIDHRLNRWLEICEPLKAVENHGPPQRWRLFT